MLRQPLPPRLLDEPVNQPLNGLLDFALGVIHEIQFLPPGEKARDLPGRRLPTADRAFFFAATNSSRAPITARDYEPCTGPEAANWGPKVANP